MASSRKYAWVWRFLLLIGLLYLLSIAPRPIQSSLEQSRAREALAAGDPLRAAGHLAKAAELLPNRLDLWEQAGHLALEGSDPEQAIAYLERARTKLSPQGWLDLGEAYAQAGNTSAAVQAWQSSLKVYGPSVEVLSRLWKTHLGLGSYPEAIDALQSLVALQPQDGDLHYRLGLLLAAREPEAAVPHLQAAARLVSSLAVAANALRGEILAAGFSGDKAYTLLSAGRSLAALGEWELAAEAFTQATLANPGYAEAWAYLGEARQHLPGDDGSPPAGGKYDGEGLAEIQQALRLDPQSLSGHMFLALYWSRLEREDLAEEAIRKAIRMHPNEPVLYVELGRLLARSGDPASAYLAYFQAASMQPEDPAYQRHIVEFALDYSFRIEETALPAAREALRLAPKDARNLDAMAQVMIRLGDLESAKTYLEQALQADEKNASVHLHLGYLLMLQGDSAGALEEFQLAESLAPGSPAAVQAERLIEGMLK